MLAKREPRVLPLAPTAFTWPFGVLPFFTVFSPGKALSFLVLVLNHFREAFAIIAGLGAGLTSGSRSSFLNLRSFFGFFLFRNRTEQDQKLADLGNLGGAELSASSSKMAVRSSLSSLGTLTLIRP